MSDGTRAMLPLRYGAMQFALNFLALPLYVFLPAYEATAALAPLATIGFLLFISRLFDAFTDPLLGQVADRALRGGQGLRLMIAASVPMLVGFLVLLVLPVLLRQPSHPFVFDAVLLGALALTYLGFSAASITHQAWGAMLAGDSIGASKLYAWREGLGLLGVVIAALATQLGGAPVYASVFAISLGLALTLLRPVPRQGHGPMDAAVRWTGWGAMLQPLRQRAFRRLLGINIVSGLASALPATLVLFFIRDRIAAPALSGLFLGIYFSCAALGAALWVRWVRRIGAASAWLAGMIGTVATFVFAATLHPGDVWGYAGVCAASGGMLGADLIVPPTLLTDLIRRVGHARSLEGAYFALWNMAAKLTLALAAGIALPMLAWLGYAPGVPSRGAWSPLTVAYCVLPSAIKILGACMLWFAWIRSGEGRGGLGTAAASPVADAGNNSPSCSAMRASAVSKLARASAATRRK